jgi:hypothetical protein
MTEPSNASPLRRVIRSVAVCFLVLAALLVAAEWLASPPGLAPGTLVSAGLVLCVSANLLSLLLLAGRRSG